MTEPLPDPPQPSAPDPAEPEIPVWAFLVVFLGSPVVMSAVILVIMFREHIANHPLATGLVVAHVVSGLALVGAYLALRNRRSS